MVSVTVNIAIEHGGVPWVHIRQTEMRENVMFVNQDGVLVNFVDFNAMMVQLESVKEYMNRNCSTSSLDFPPPPPPDLDHPIEPPAHELPAPPIEMSPIEMSPIELPASSIELPASSIELPHPELPAPPSELPAIELPAIELPPDDVIDSFCVNSFIATAKALTNTMVNVLTTPIPKILHPPKKGRRTFSIEWIKAYAQMLLPIIQQLMRDACAGCQLQLAVHDNCICNTIHVGAFLNDALDVLNNDYADSMTLQQHASPRPSKAVFKASKLQRMRLVRCISKLM